LRLANDTLKLSIDIRDDLLAEMVRHGRKFYPKEYGGILVGRYSENNTVVMIEEIVLPLNYKASAFSFERGTKGLRDALLKHFKSNPILVYVGEWHTHPNGSTIPSITDTDALKKIAKHESVFIENPVLVIIALNKIHQEFGFYVWYQNQVYSYEKEQTLPKKSKEEDVTK
jgi:integrative and conjugative element protein (TIGR02256 family)